MGALSRRYPDGTWRTYTGSDGLSGAELGPLYETNDGSLLVGSKKGLMMLVPGLERIANTPESGQGPWQFIGEDDQGNVWSFDHVALVLLFALNYRCPPHQVAALPSLRPPPPSQPGLVVRPCRRVGVTEGHSQRAR